MDSNTMVLAADIGKSRCRVELRKGVRDVESGIWRSEVLAAADSEGFPGLGMHNGAAEAFLLITETTARLQPAAPPGLVPDGIPADGQQPFLSPLDGVGAAVAGVEASAEQSVELARLLAGYFGVPAAVLSDATAAHLGALHRQPGTVLIVGTGAVAFRFEREGNSETNGHRYMDGVLRRSDGWGPLLGDRGSGRWMGQEGLQAVLEAHDGGPATALSRHAATLVPSPEKLPAWLASQANQARAMARFAPKVLAEAEAGDAVARGIVDEACRLLTVTVKRAVGTDAGLPGTSAPPQVALLGGVVQSGFFAGLLTRSLTAGGIEVVAAQGDGLTGASLAATGRELLQERYIHRAGQH